MNEHGSRFDRAVTVFREKSGILCTAQALHAGIDPSTLYAICVMPGRLRWSVVACIILPEANHWEIPTW